MKFLIFVGMTLRFTLDSLAQPGIIIAQDGVYETVETCLATFTDTGGAGGNYYNNEDLGVTICPDVPNAYILIDFSPYIFLTEENLDVFTVYNGADTTAPVIGEYSGSNNPGQISSTSADGCLTFKFTSNIVWNYSGWRGFVTCPTAEIIQIELENGLTPTIYPNPTSGDVTLDISLNLTYQVYNCIGQLVLSGTKHDDEVKTIHTDNLPSGIYQLVLAGQESNLNFTTRIVKL